MTRKTGPKVGNRSAPTGVPSLTMAECADDLYGRTDQRVNPKTIRRQLGKVKLLGADGRILESKWKSSHCPFWVPELRRPLPDINPWASDDDDDDDEKPELPRVRRLLLVEDIVRMLTLTRHPKSAAVVRRQMRGKPHFLFGGRLAMAATDFDIDWWLGLSADGRDDTPFSYSYKTRDGHVHHVTIRPDKRRRSEPGWIRQRRTDERREYAAAIAAAKNGTKRTTAEKRDSILAVLKVSWGASNRKIGALLNVDHKTVAAARKATKWRAEKFPRLVPIDRKFFGVAKGPSPRKTARLEK